MSALPVLYSFRRCPYAMRARLAILLAEQSCELREVLLRRKPDAMLRASPKGTVPVLVLSDGVVLEESRAIMDWALGENDPLSLTRHDPEAEALIDQTDGPFKTALDHYKYASRYDNAPEIHRDRAAQFLMDLDLRLSRSRYLTGDARHCADLAIAPFVRQFANTDRAWFDAQPWPNLIRWIEEFLASVEFATIMAKFEPWEPDVQGVTFPQQVI